MANSGRQRSEDGRSLDLSTGLLLNRTQYKTHIGSHASDVDYRLLGPNSCKGPQFHQIQETRVPQLAGHTVVRKPAVESQTMPAFVDNAHCRTHDISASAQLPPGPDNILIDGFPKSSWELLIQWNKDHPNDEDGYAPSPGTPAHSRVAKRTMDDASSNEIKRQAIEAIENKEELEVQGSVAAITMTRDAAEPSITKRDHDYCPNNWPGFRSYNWPLGMRRYFRFKNHKQKLPVVADRGPQYDHNLESRCTPAHIDIRLLGGITCSAVEILTALVRGFETENFMKGSTIAKRLRRAHTENVTSAFVCSEISSSTCLRNVGNHEDRPSDYFLIDLAEGVASFPSGKDARKLTAAVQYTMQTNNEKVKLSQVEEYVRENSLCTSQLPVVNTIADGMAYWRHFEALDAHKKTTKERRK
ncbi:hypothetical protein BS50DRAFT_630871 [Corynespora cassiicola Philippines]|uniref:Uncharacterized protein n=1 Tax=Corynespora cassiicola Philippines TaxID=1448308 RepID=A0A2T2NZF3_CORCC|nr:hypothetical protein BS50DRAFT_630871 [Corynespora cassiicola Philippines]